MNPELKGKIIAFLAWLTDYASDGETAEAAQALLDEIDLEDTYDEDQN